MLEHVRTPLQKRTNEEYIRNHFNSKHLEEFQILKLQEKMHHFLHYFQH